MTVGLRGTPGAWTIPLLALAVLAACGADPLSATGTSQPADATASVSLGAPVTSSGTTSSGARPRLAARPIASYTFVVDDPAWITLTKDGIAFTTTTESGQPVVEVMRPGAREPNTVYTGPVGAVVEAVNGGADYVTWTTDSQQQDDPMQPVSWRIYSFNLHTGKTAIAASSTKPTPAPPWSVMSGDRIAWVGFDGTKNDGSDIYLTDLRSSVTHKVVSNVISGQVALNATTLVFTKTVGTPTSATDVGKSDLFAVDLRSGETRRLTTTGDVDLPVLSGRWLSWESGRPDNGQAMAGMKLPDGPILTYPADLQGWLETGNGFSAYFGPSGVTAIPLARHARPRVLAYDSNDACVACGISVLDSEVAWADTRGDKTTVTVDAIGLS